MKPSLVELKAKAYDILGQIQFLQMELEKVNQAIANFKEEEAPKEEKENG